MEQRNPDSIEDFLRIMHIDPADSSSNQTVFMHAIAIPTGNLITGYLLLYYAANAKNVQFPVSFSDSSVGHSAAVIFGKNLGSLLTECEEQLKLDGLSFTSQSQTDSAGKLVARTYRFKIFTLIELSRLSYILGDFKELYG